MMLCNTIFAFCDCSPGESGLRFCQTVQAVRETPTMKPKLATLVLLLFVLSGCSFVRGSGNIVTQERTLDAADFQEIQLSIDANITVTQGERTFLTVRGDDNIVEEIATTVRNNELQIRMSDPFPQTILRPTQPVEIRVTTPTLRSVSLSGSGDVAVDGFAGEQMALNVSGSGTVSTAELSVDQLEIHIAGSGNISVKGFSGDELAIRISGSGDAVVAGAANKAEFSVSGSGTIDAEDLSTNRSEVSISGSGDVSTWAKEALDVHISGSGNVSYYGNPQVSHSVSGSGDVESLGRKE